MLEKYRLHVNGALVGPDQMRTRIRRIGKLLRIVCSTACILLLLYALLCLAVATLSAAGVEMPEFFRTEPDRNFLYNVLYNAARLDQMEGAYRGAIYWFLGAVNMTLLFFYARIIRRLTGTMADGDKPFTHDGAKMLRKSTLLTIPLALFSPIAFLGILLISILFSYLFDYGAFLQGEAEKTNKIQEEIIVSFAEITENKSGQTGKHVKRVSEYSRILASQLGYSAEEAENIRLASTMHDIGKLLVPGEILEKPGKLTDEEFGIIKQHTIFGGDLLKNVEGDVMHLSRTIALEHHERPDGKGYPAGLKGNEIAPEARIVAVADVYDALTSKRSYKSAWDPEKARQEILQNRGTQFDEKVVDAFNASYDRILEARAANLDA